MTEQEYHLRVYLDRSELWDRDILSEAFSEGQISIGAKKRYKGIADQLRAGFLTEFIARCKESPESFTFETIDGETRDQLEAIANSMTSEKGRALVHILTLQLTVKALEPNQSIRLHKANSQASKFGWVEGLSMRSLDAEFITPALREANLSKVNKDGAFMTRSFAENYPYSRVYKAGILGARDEWLDLVDKIEGADFDPLEGLAVVLFRLINLADDFEKMANSVLNSVSELIRTRRFTQISVTEQLLLTHMETSDYSARLMEIVMHSLLQAIEELNGLAGMRLNPLTQMRSANLKHSNFGDIELTLHEEIVTSWDAKYAKANLREELEELDSKFTSNTPPSIFGFVTSVKPELTFEIIKRMNELSGEHVVSISILKLGDWIFQQAEAAVNAGVQEHELSEHWLMAYTESLAQRRRAKAPIDEPCFEWLKSLGPLLVEC
jgi:hypothetical protein